MGRDSSVRITHTASAAELPPMAALQLTRACSSIQRFRQYRAPGGENPGAVPDRMLEEIAGDREVVNRAEHRRAFILEREQSVEARAAPRFGRLLGAALRAAG